jgi:hypothetical protein
VLASPAASQQPAVQRLICWCVTVLLNMLRLFDPETRLRDLN